MLQTYKAVLRGDHIEWVGEAPQRLEQQQPVDVHVTILSEASAAHGGTSRGVRMAEALERLASINALPSIIDPVSWQHEQRQDRQLPGRDER